MHPIIIRSAPYSCLLTAIAYRPFDDGVWFTAAAKASILCTGCTCLELLFWFYECFNSSCSPTFDPAFLHMMVVIALAMLLLARVISYRDSLHVGPRHRRSIPTEGAITQCFVLMSCFFLILVFIYIFAVVEDGSQIKKGLACKATNRSAVDFISRWTFQDTILCSAPRLRRLLSLVILYAGTNCWMLFLSHIERNTRRSGNSRRALQGASNTRENIPIIRQVGAHGNVKAWYFFILDYSIIVLGVISCLSFEMYQYWHAIPSTEGVGYLSGEYYCPTILVSSVMGWLDWW